MIPFAPASIVVSIARFIVRRKLARLAKLVGDILRDKLGLNLGALHFLDLDVDPPADELLELLLQPLDLLPLAADDQARAGNST